MPPRKKTIARKTPAASPRREGRPVVSTFANLPALHAHYEALRDAEDSPARLFALAVDEARALDAFTAPGTDPRALTEALASALFRVLEGPGEGIDADGLNWSLARMEGLLRGAGARSLEGASMVRALDALAHGYALAGDLAAVQKTLARAVKRARSLFDEDPAQWIAYDRALALAWELSANAHDARAMASWARARADAQSLRPEGPDPDALCEALAPLPQLWAELEAPEKGLSAAREWLAAEATRSGRRAGAGLLDALRAQAAAAHAVFESATPARQPAAAGEFVDAARAWVQGARAAVLRETDGGDPGFALARLAESLSAVTDAEAIVGDVPAATERAREWLAAECAVAEGALSDGCLAAISALDSLAEHAPLALRAAAAESVLTALAGAGPEAEKLRSKAVGDSARAHFVLRRPHVAAERARSWLATGTGPDAVVMRVILARCEEAGASTVSRARAAKKSGTGAARKPAALVAVELAAQARDEWLAGAARGAAKRADEALETLRGVRGVPGEARDYVHFVHECARPGASVTGGAECAARALAAVEVGDPVRAAELLGAIRWEKSKMDATSIAHALAACVTLVERFSPGDPTLDEGMAAWRDLAENAVLGGPALSPR